MTDTDHILSEYLVLRLLFLRTDMSVTSLTFQSHACRTVIAGGSFWFWWNLIQVQ